MADDFQIPIVKSKDRIGRSTGIIWGQIKTGKSTFLTSLPGRTLFLMVDPDGDESLADSDDLQTMNLFDHKDDEIIRMLEKRVPSHIIKHASEFDSVVLDSITTVNRIALNDAIAKGVGEGRDFVPSLDAPGQAAYGARTQHTVDVCAKLLRATAAVGKHMWFTAHEDEPKTNPKGEVLYTSVTMSGKAISAVGSLVSEIYHLRFRDGKWTLSIAPCRGRKPMGSRMFDVTGEFPEFRLQFDPELGADQPHSIATWFKQYVEGGRKKLPLPKPLKG